MQEIKLKVGKLVNSLTKLRGSIEAAKHSLVQDNSEEANRLIKRLFEYESIVTKQETLASELLRHIDDQNLAEILRHTKLLNGLTNMIHQDASELAEILESGQVPEDTQPRVTN